jgi:hypothetical protein
MGGLWSGGGWLRRLAQVALERKASLQEIRIQFDPEYWGPDARKIDYPWDQMDALNKDFQARGIIITYTKPKVTREEWSASLVQVKREMESNPQISD